MLRVKNNKPADDKAPKDEPKDKKPGDKPSDGAKDKPKDKSDDKKPAGPPSGGAPPMDMPAEGMPMDPMMDAGAPPMGMPGMDMALAPIPMEETDAAVSHLMIAQLLLKSYMDGSLPFSAATGGELMNHIQGALDAISMEAPPPMDPMAAMAPMGPAGPPMPEPPPGGAGGMV